MKAQDWMENDNERAKVVERLSELCHALGLSFHYSEKRFTIDLPETVPVDVVGPHPKRRRIRMDMFDQLENWLANNRQADDILPDELPPIDTPLDEGEAPKGDSEP